MAEAVVEFDYDAVNGDELDLHKGAIIKNINMMEGGWWEGEVDGKRGMFPDNFVKVIEKAGSAQKPAASSSSSSTSSSLSKSSSMKSHGQGPVANGDVSLGSQEMGDEAKVKKREGGIKKGKMRAKVTYSYSPQNDDELELVVDDLVEVIDQPEEGWWEGVIKGQHGLFPSNFVTLVDESDGPEAKSDTLSSSGGNTPLEEDKPVKKVIKGIGHGNIFADGMPQLRKTPKVDKDVRTQAKDESHPFALKRMSLRKKENEEKKDEEKKEDKNTSSSEKGLFKVKVIYDYEPKNADELQLKKGEIVTVVDKDAGDSGWWKGELNGKVGVFPDNFTEEIHDEKIKKKNVHAPVPARPASGVFRGDDHHSQAPPPRPTRPGSMEMKKTAITKQPSQDSIKPSPKETSVNGSRHLAGAKQVLPPPTAGRPQVSHKPTALAKPQAAAKPHDIKEISKDSTDSGKTDPKESTFDNIKINSEKLTHLNLSRPKATPNRRPPSAIGVPPVASSTSSSSSSSPPDDTPTLAPRSKHKKLLPSSSLAPIPDHVPTSTPSNTTSSASSSSSSSKPGEDSTPSKTASHPPPPTAALPEKPRPEHLPPRPSVDHTPVPKESASSDPPWKTELKNRTNKSSASASQSAENGSGPPGRPKASPAQSSSTASTLDTSSGAPPRPAVAVTKTTTSSNSSKDGASSAEVQDLKKEIKSLHETIASIKTEFKKEVKKLMTEVDEEKKHRMMMQVELERIKKLVMEGD